MLGRMSPRFELRGHGCAVFANGIRSLHMADKRFLCCLDQQPHLVGTYVCLNSLNLKLKKERKEAENISGIAHYSPIIFPKKDKRTNIYISKFQQFGPFWWPSIDLQCWIHSNYSGPSKLESVLQLIHSNCAVESFYELSGVSKQGSLNCTGTTVFNISLLDWDLVQIHGICFMVAQAQTLSLDFKLRRGGSSSKNSRDIHFPQNTNNWREERNWSQGSGPLHLRNPEWSCPEGREWSPPSPLHPPVVLIPPGLQVALVFFCQQFLYGSFTPLCKQECYYVMCQMYFLTSHLRRDGEWGLLKSRTQQHCNFCSVPSLIRIRWEAQYLDFSGF